MVKDLLASSFEALTEVSSRGLINVPPMGIVLVVTRCHTQMNL
jgi:hypothetical protein